MEVNYFSEDVDYQLNNTCFESEWVAKIAQNEEVDVAEVSYIFCSDEYLHKINVDYLNHDTLTDIITFDYCEGGLVTGDIFISIERVSENAEKFNVEFEEELARVMAHGLLHLIGYKDKSPEEQKVMREKEDLCLTLRS